MTADVHLDTAEATEHAGAALAAGLADGAVITVDGPLGAGKTTFARGVGMGLGLDPAHIASPSFTIVVEHRLEDGRVFRHIDAWRLGGSADLESLGWHEWIGAPGTITLIEWSSRIADALPQDAQRLLLDYAEGSGRVLVDASGEMP